MLKIAKRFQNLYFSLISGFVSVKTKQPSFLFQKYGNTFNQLPKLYAQIKGLYDFPDIMLIVHLVTLKETAELLTIVLTNENIPIQDVSGAFLRTRKLTLLILEA